MAAEEPLGFHWIGDVLLWGDYIDGFKAVLSSVDSDAENAKVGDQGYNSKHMMRIRFWWKLDSEKMRQSFWRKSNVVNWWLLALLHFWSSRHHSMAPTSGDLGPFREKEEEACTTRVARSGPGPIRWFVKFCEAFGLLKFNLSDLPLLEN